jgi:predicted transcriptional regulator
METSSPDDLRAAVRDLTRSGWSEDRIAALLRVSDRTVRRYRADMADRASEVRGSLRRLKAEIGRDEP